MNLLLGTCPVEKFADVVGMLLCSTTGNMENASQNSRQTQSEIWIPWLGK
jgi:hypothetical protein